MLLYVRLSWILATHALFLALLLTRVIRGTDWNWFSRLHSSVSLRRARRHVLRILYRFLCAQEARTWLPRRGQRICSGVFSQAEYLLARAPAVWIRAPSEAGRRGIALFLSPVRGPTLCARYSVLRSLSRTRVLLLLLQLQTHHCFVAGTMTPIATKCLCVCTCVYHFVCLGFISLLPSLCCYLSYQFIILSVVSLWYIGMYGCENGHYRYWFEQFAALTIRGPVIEQKIHGIIIFSSSSSLLCSSSRGQQLTFLDIFTHFGHLHYILSNANCAQ